MKLGKGGILHVVPVSDDRLFMDAGTKVMEIELPSMKASARWTGRGEGISSLAVSPGRKRVVYTSAAYDNPGSIILILLEDV